MNNRTFIQRKLLNLFQATLLIAAMAALLALSAELLFGRGVWPGVFIGVAIGLLLVPAVSPQWVLSVFKARKLTEQEAPELHAIVSDLAQRAKLPRSPELYWLPSWLPNAFSVGHRHHAAIALTHGLLKQLTLREMTGVLAHEVSHIHNNDMRLMSIADTVTRLTHVMASTAFFLALFAIPFALFGYVVISPLAIILLLCAPVVSALLQLTLSRNREFLADLEAVHLTGDAEGLASALSKIEYQEMSFFRRLFYTGRKGADASLLRTHPATHQRIEKLLNLKPPTAH